RPQEPPLRRGAGDHREGRAHALPGLRGADLVLGARLRRGQEGELARRLRRPARDRLVPVLRLAGGCRRGAAAGASAGAVMATVHARAKCRMVVVAAEAVPTFTAGWRRVAPRTR